MDELYYLEDELKDEYGVDELDNDIWEMEKAPTFPHAYKVLIGLRYIFSIVFIGIPWICFGFSGVVWNFVINAWLN